jgi:hypothetical protein
VSKSRSIEPVTCRNPAEEAIFATMGTSRRQSALG